jgi:hypothetical protein
MICKKYGGVEVTEKQQALGLVEHFLNCERVFQNWTH